MSQGAADSNEAEPAKQRSVKERAKEEAKRFFFIALYVWVVISAFNLHRSMVLEDTHLVVLQRQGFALINALVLAKVILLADALRLGHQLERAPLIRAVFLKSILFAVVLMLFHVIERSLVAMIRHEKLGSNVADFAGGDLWGLLQSTVVAAIVLVPFFAFQEVGRLIGPHNLWRLFFARSAHRFRLVIEE
jgi:hypothetical protein